MTYPGEDDLTISSQKLHDDPQNLNVTIGNVINMSSSNEDVNLWKKLLLPSKRRRNPIQAVRTSFA